MKIVIVVLTIVITIATCGVIMKQQNAVNSLQTQLSAAKATISKLGKGHTLNKTNYGRAVKHWQKFVSDSKITAELSASNKTVTQKQFELNAFRSELVDDGFVNAFRILTPFERDLFAQSVDLTIYTMDGFIGKQSIERVSFIPINLNDKRSPGEQLWQAISMPEEHDYQSSWTIFEDGSAKKVSEAYNRELKKEGIEIPKKAE